MRVLILGGTGPLGRALIRNLRTANANAHIAVISRTLSALPGASRVVAGDQTQLLPSPEFADDLASFDAVVHLGDGLGPLQRGGGSSLAGEADRLVAGSEAIARAVASARVPLFVYVSSIKAHSDDDEKRVGVEGSDPRPTTHYPSCGSSGESLPSWVGR
jgi:nucleoside-diphosphate-sugar epimerase